MTAFRLWLLGFAVFAVAWLAMAATFAHAHALVCFPIAQTLLNMERLYGEVPAYSGATSSGEMFVLGLNAETGSWTVYLSPNGKTICAVATGSGFDDASEALKALAVPGKDSSLAGDKKGQTSCLYAPGMSF